MWNNRLRFEDQCKLYIDILMIQVILSDWYPVLYSTIIERGHERSNSPKTQKNCYRIYLRMKFKDN